MQILIALLAGLGFIFVGTQFLTANMKQVAGPRFHTLVAGATRSPWRAAAVGVAAGAVIQSTNAVTFIIVSLVGAGAATVKAAMPIVTWSYAGSTLRLLLASIDLGTATLVMIALVGIAYLLGYDRDARHRHLVGAVLGLALLLYGVQFMVQAAVPLRQSEGLRALLGLADSFYLWGFVAGAVLASFIQGQTLSVIAIALTEGGLLGLDQTMLVVVGANLGTGIQAIVQGAGLKGTVRQLNLYQLVLKLIGVGVLLPLLMLEHWGGVPTVRALASAVSKDAGVQVTLVHWLFQISSALVASAVNAPLFRLIERLSPATAEEALAKPEFIDRRAAAQPEAALGMIAHEQRRLLHRLPDFLAPLRPPEPGAATPPAPRVLRDAGNELARAVDAFMRDALQNPMPKDELERLLRLWNGNELLAPLHDALAELAATLPKAGTDAEVARVRANMVEALHAMLLVLVDEADHPEDAGLAGVGDLQRLTADRSAMMRRIRDDLARHSPDLPVAERQAVWRATDLFERITWLLRRYAVNLGEHAAPEDGGETAAPASAAPAPTPAPTPARAG